MIKLFISLFVLQRGTLKARFLLKATVLRLRGGKRPCNLWRLLSLISLNRRPVSHWRLLWTAPPPGGGEYVWRGDLTDGFFALPVCAAYTWRGLFSQFYRICYLNDTRKKTTDECCKGFIKKNNTQAIMIAFNLNNERETHEVSEEMPILATLLELTNARFNSQFKMVKFIR